MYPPNKEESGRGFSLVEIVLALGLITICLVPLVGILGIALNQGRVSQQTLEVGLVLQSMESHLLGEAALGTVVAAPGEGGSTNSFERLVSSLRGGSYPTRYFSRDGRPLGTNASDALAFYSCSVRVLAQAQNSRWASVPAIVEIRYPAPGFEQSEIFTIPLFPFGTKW